MTKSGLFPARPFTKLCESMPKYWVRDADGGLLTCGQINSVENILGSVKHRNFERTGASAIYFETDEPLSRDVLENFRNAGCEIDEYSSR